MVTWLDRGDLRLGLVPELGGRLLSVRHRGVELLWRNTDLLDDYLRGEYAPNSGQMGDWVNYGGDKTWPAPQGWEGPDQWPGPPGPVLDSGPYSVATDGDTVTMTSAPDPRTGLRFTRAITLLDDGYRLDLRAENVSSRPVRWALWNVTQLPGGGPVTAGLRRPEVVALVAGTGTPEYTVDGDRLVVPAQDVVGKLGVPGTAGWVTYGALTLSFEVDPAGEYPDEGSPLEIWLEHPLPAPLAELGDLDPPARIVELEVLGPLTTLAPGEVTGLSIRAEVREDDV
ncbi:hypothetical protein Amsp01_021130 [Amycolatopsis sp. NBRC 101858]|uniref:DUF4380 domain-containing protein n=1 Tax=Amycolatopsis sp. NBRC 101858 TaxID=3032200 RepID=UPI0024A1F5EC|nr:DUF4380 domain-containing protein [Amycolatopsis sp. NBRC 101858]GLY36089.1 hypothetical protein Amsp01_021130 [Amycolatopsis sp. NBRC 101858]